MGFGASFWVTIIIGFVVRNLAYLVSVVIYQDLKTRKKFARFLQIIILAVVGFITALPSIDFIGLSLTGVYVGILFIDFIISDPIMNLILRGKDLIIHSRFVTLLMVQANIWQKKTREYLKIKSKPGEIINDPLPPPNRPTWQVVLLYLLFIIKDIAYEAIARKLAEWSINALENARKAVNIFLDYVVETFIGDILTEIMRWINNISFVVPQIALRVLITGFDLLFAFFPSMSFGSFRKQLNRQNQR